MQPAHQGNVGWPFVQMAHSGMDLHDHYSTLLGQRLAQAHPPALRSITAAQHAGISRCALCGSTPRGGTHWPSMSTDSLTACSPVP
jgi:hypothetical protein